MAVEFSAADFKCSTCRFQLYTPIANLPSSLVGLYDDSRFPGRLIVSLNQHFEDLDELPPELLNSFMADVQLVSQVVKQVTGSERVNFAILGNSVPHVHAHMIPRFPKDEKFPGKSPWNDPRPLQKLSDEKYAILVSSYQSAFKLLQ